MKSENSFDLIHAIESEIGTQSFKPVYMFAGTEDYLVYYARKKTADALKRSRSGTMIEIYDGNELSITDLLAKLNSPSLFEPFRVLIVRDAPYFSAKYSNRADQLREWFQAASKRVHSLPVIPIFTATAVDNRLAINKTIKKVGHLVEFETAKLYERGDPSKDPYAQPVKQFLTSLNKSISPKAWVALRHRADNNLWCVMNALEVLIAYIEPRNEIAVMDVMDMTAPGDDIPVFALTEALSERKTEEVRISLEKLLETGTPALMINKMLSNRIRQLILIQSMLQSIASQQFQIRMEYWQFKQQIYPPLKAIIDANPMFTEHFGSTHPFAFFQMIQQAMKFKTSALMECFKELAHIDIALKSSTKPPQILLEAAILPLCR